MEEGCKLHSSITTSAFTYVSEDSLYLALPRPLAVLLYKATHRNKHEASMKLGRDSGGSWGDVEIWGGEEKWEKAKERFLGAHLKTTSTPPAWCLCVVAFSCLKASRATVLSFLHKAMVLDMTIIGTTDGWVCCFGTIMCMNFWVKVGGMGIFQFNTFSEKKGTLLLLKKNLHFVGTLHRMNHPPIKKNLQLLHKKKVSLDLSL